jgi:hypothetical protein
VVGSHLANATYVERANAVKAKWIRSKKWVFVAWSGKNETALLMSLF